MGLVEVRSGPELYLMWTLGLSLNHITCNDFFQIDKKIPIQGNVFKW